MTENARDPAAAILRRMEDAWNAADGAGFGAAFAEDADFIDIRGDHHRGRAAIAHGHQAILDTIYRGSTNRYELIDARPLGDAVLVALARATLRVPGGPLAGEHRATQTLVLARCGGAWEVTAFQNTPIAPPTAP